MPPKKQATKGQKQIFEENQETLAFYRKLIIASNAFYLFIWFLRRNTMPWSDIFLFVLSSSAFIGSFKFLSYMAKPTFSAQGQLTDGGIDLSMSEGTAEHIKDIIILTVGCQCLSVFSNYFWLLWLLVPGKALYMLWKYVLGPWFFQPAPEQPSDGRTEKKQRKLERKMARARQ